MTSQLIPQLLAVWSAPGDGYTAVGDVATASGHFQKVLSFNPDAKLAAYATESLESLKGR